MDNKDNKFISLDEKRKQVQAEKEAKAKAQQPQPLQKPSSLDLLKHVPDGHFKTYVDDVAKMCVIHPSTSLLIALGVVSSVAARVYSVQYPNGEALPLGEYVAAGSAPGSGKSRLLKNFQHAIFKAQREAYKQYKQREEAAEQAGQTLDEEPPLMIFLSDSTMEGLEPMLKKTGGFFALASAEQGVINTMMGASYGSADRKNNNDLALKGFNGEYHASSRSSRSGYIGDVVGAVTCFAQDAAIETILSKSEGSGMAERFLMIVEPTQLGTRDHLNHYYPQEYSQNVFNRILGELTHKALTMPTEFMELPQFHIDKADWVKIHTFRNEIEPHLADGGKYSTATMRGIASKVDMHIMKIATLLAIIDGKSNQKLPSHYIESAIGIMRDMLEHALSLLFKTGLVGFDAEENAIISYLGKYKGATSRQVQQAKFRVKPFKESQDPYGAIRKTIDRLIDKQVVAERETYDPVGQVTRNLYLIS